MMVMMIIINIRGVLDLLERAADSFQRRKYGGDFWVKAANVTTVSQDTGNNISLTINNDIF